MDNPLDGGDVEVTKLDSEARKSHIRSSDDSSDIPSKVMKLQEGDDALTNQMAEEAEQEVALANDIDSDVDFGDPLINQNAEEAELVVPLANDIDSDVDLGDDDEYEEDLTVGTEGAEPKEIEEEEEEQLDLDADYAGESDQAGEFDGEEDFDEYEDELGTTAEETEDNINDEEEEADSSTELQDFVQANLAYIEDCQSDIDTLNHEANEEILRVEQKYNKLRLPVYKRRNTYIERVPHFWATVFSQHSQLRQVLTKEDIKCLKSVTRLQVEDFEDNRSGYSIQFYFNKNPWFDNLVITKEYHLPWHGSPSCTCTPIQWKKGMNLTQKRSSFFSWFTSQDDASADDIAEIIKDDLWPNPLQCFLMTNKQMEESEEDEDEADDSGNLPKDDSVVLLDESREDDVEYISSDEEEEGEWAGKGRSTQAHYLVQDDDEEQDDEEYDEYDEEETGGNIEVGRAGDVVQEKVQRRTEGEVITVDDDYLESDEDEENEYFDGTGDLGGVDDLGVTDDLDGDDERLLGDRGDPEAEESDEEGGGGVKERLEVNRVDSSHGDSSRDDGNVNEDSRHSNGLVGSTNDILDVGSTNDKTVTPSVNENAPSNSESPIATKIQEQSKVVSTSTVEGESDITAGAT